MSLQCACAGEAYALSVMDVRPHCRRTCLQHSARVEHIKGVAWQELVDGQRVQRGTPHNERDLLQQPVRIHDDKTVCQRCVAVRDNTLHMQKIHVQPERDVVCALRSQPPSCPPLVPASLGWVFACESTIRGVSYSASWRRLAMQVDSSKHLGKQGVGYQILVDEPDTG